MVDKDLHTLKINCKGEITAGKANKGIKIEKIITDFLKREKKNKGKKEKATSTELQKPNVEVEVYNNNKDMWLKGEKCSKT